jgi:hypothetical protein
MIGYFPEAYPDELLYSVCARCFDRLCYPSKQSLVQELFGTRTTLACIELPSHLDTLISALPTGHHYTADQLIDNHTLLPFYGPFLPPSRLDRLRQDMHGDNGPTIHMRSGIMASRVFLPRWLRFCALCVQEDRKECGECYWHRTHQVPGVEVCPCHKIHLKNSSILAQNSRTRYEFVSAERAVQQIAVQEPIPLAPYQKVLLSVALDAQWLLAQHRLSHDLQSLYRRYSKLLTDLDLATYKGRVFIGELQQKFTSRFSPEILELLSCKIDERINENWLVRLVRKPDNAQHPLHHLLLIHFLGHSAETFFKLPTVDQPFGQGPWPCLNPVSNHYQHDQISECQIVCSQYVGGRPIGTFSCTCGFTYSRTGTDMSLEDRFKFSKVKSFGGLWEGRLRLLWEDETVSLRGIARQLKVDPLTVKRHAMRIGLTFPRPAGTSLPLKETQQLRLTKRGEVVPNMLETYRATWLLTMKEWPDANTNELRNKLAGVFSWLYRNDKAWLREHLPHKRPARKQPSYVDWKERDSQLARSVEEAAKCLSTLPGRPVRISFAAIGREVGQLKLLQQHLDKLPLTARVMTGFIETREMFAVRKVFWVAEKYREEQLYPARWQLVKRAGVGRIASLPSVQEAIDTALQVLNVSVHASLEVSK